MQRRCDVANRIDFDGIATVVAHPAITHPLSMLCRQCPQADRIGADFFDRNHAFGILALRAIRAVTPGAVLIENCAS